jgi:hypothetical protein
MAAAFRTTPGRAMAAAITLLLAVLFLVNLVKSLGQMHIG